MNTFISQEKESSSVNYDAYECKKIIIGSAKPYYGFPELSYVSLSRGGCSQNTYNPSFLELNKYLLYLFAYYQSIYLSIIHFFYYLFSRRRYCDAE